MGEASRITAVIGAVMFFAGVGLAFHLAFIHTRPKEQAMGYSNGEGCFDGECKNQPSLTTCVSCCSSRCPQWAEACIDKCLEKFDPKTAYAELAAAGERVGAKDAGDYVAFCRAVTLLKHAPQSRDRRFARVARLIAREAEERSGLTLASAK